MGIDASRSRTVRRCAAWLFVAAAGLYVTTGDGLIHPSDGVVLFNVSDSLVQGRLDIDELPKWPGFGGPKIVDPRTGQTHRGAGGGRGAARAGGPRGRRGRAGLP